MSSPRQRLPQLQPDSPWRGPLLAGALVVPASLALHLIIEGLAFGGPTRGLWWSTAHELARATRALGWQIPAICLPPLLAAIRGRRLGPEAVGASALLLFLAGIFTSREAGVPGPVTVTVARVVLAGAFAWALSQTALIRRAGQAALLAAGTALALLIAPALQPASPGPRVLMISVDTLRADHMGLYGYHRPTTPNLDALLGRGTVFERGLAGAPCTEPSVLQTLTGRRDFARSAPRIAEVLQNEGWRTAAFSTQIHFSDAFGSDPDYARGFDRFQAHPTRKLGAEKDFTASLAMADELTQQALDWAGTVEPEFLWVHYFDPHDAYEPPDRWRLWDEGSAKYPTGDRRKYLVDAQDKLPQHIWQKRGRIFDPEDVAHFAGLYDGEIAFTDEQIGRLIDGLEESGWLEDAIILFWSDHGEFLGEDDLWDHCITLRNEVQHVPLAVVTPDGPLAGADPGQFASTLDLFPTLLGLLDLPTPEGLDGQDLSKPDADRIILTHWSNTAAAWQGDHQLIIEDDTTTLRHWSDAHYRDHSEANPDLRRSLEEALRADPAAAALAERTADTLDALKAMGYVE